MTNTPPPRAPRDTDSFGRPLPATARRLTERMPPRHQRVLLYITDTEVAIRGFPIVGWNTGTDESPSWWAGVPGSYINLLDQGWTITHWAHLPGDGTSRINAAGQPTATACAQA